MLERVKKALRISFDQLDDEILGIIEAGKIDLEMGGVKNIDEEDPLIIRALIIYAKAHFGQNADNERYHYTYSMLKLNLALSTKYNQLLQEGEV